MIYLSNEGLVKKAINLKKTEVVDILRRLGTNILNNSYGSKEQNTLNPIIKAFEQETWKLIFFVVGHRTDLHIHDWKLEIECNENGHTDRDKKLE